MLRFFHAAAALIRHYAIFRCHDDAAAFIFFQVAGHAYAIAATFSPWRRRHAAIFIFAALRHTPHYFDAITMPMMPFSPCHAFQVNGAAATLAELLLPSPRYFFLLPPALRRYFFRRRQFYYAIIAALRHATIGIQVAAATSLRFSIDIAEASMPLCLLL